jgi:flagellar biogenesis protein FliO
MNDPSTRKKLFWAAALGGALLVSLLFISLLAPSSPSTPINPTIRPDENGQLLLDSGAKTESQSTDSGHTSGFSLGGGQLVSLAWRLALVVVIIAGSIAGLRWWGRNTQGPKSTTGFLRVLDTLAISQGRTIHLVGIGERVIAVGATAQQLTLLNELSEDESRHVFEEAAKPDDAPISQFASQLFEQMKRTTGRTVTSRHEAVIGE